MTPRTVTIRITADTSGFRRAIFEGTKWRRMKSDPNPFPRFAIFRRSANPTDPPKEHHADR